MCSSVYIFKKCRVILFHSNPFLNWISFYCRVTKCVTPKWAVMPWLLVSLYEYESVTWVNWIYCVYERWLKAEMKKSCRSINSWSSNFCIFNRCMRMISFCENPFLYSYYPTKGFFKCPAVFNVLYWEKALLKLLAANNFLFCNAE